MDCPVHYVLCPCNYKANSSTPSRRLIATIDGILSMAFDEAKIVSQYVCPDKAQIQ